MFPTRLITVLKRLSVPAGLLFDMRAYHISPWVHTVGPRCTNKLLPLKGSNFRPRNLLNGTPDLAGALINGPIVDRSTFLLVNRLHTQSDLASIVDGKDLYFHLVAFPDNIRHRRHAA